MISRRALRAAATVGPALISLAIAVFALIGETQLAAARDAVARTRDITESLQTVLLRLTDAETAQRGYLLTGGREYLEPGAGAAADVHRSLASARRLIADSAEQRQIDTLSAVIADKLAELNASTRAYDSGGTMAAARMVRSGRGQELMTRARELISGVTLQESARLEAREARESRLHLVTTTLIFVAIVLAALLSLLVSSMISRALTARELADQRRGHALTRLEALNHELSDQATEMEAQAVELEQSNQDLHGVTEDLARQREEAEQARARMANVLDTMSDAFISFDSDWIIRQLNRQGVILTNGGNPSIVGRSVWDLWGPSIAPELASKLRSAMDGESMEPFEFEVAPNYWFEIRMNRTSDGLAIFFRDVTEQRRARVEREQLIEQVQAEHSRLITVVQQSPLAISIVEAPTGRRIIANRAAEEVFGMPLTASLAETTPMLKGFNSDGAELAPNEWPLVQSVKEGREVINHIVEVERPNGERRRVCFNSSPVRDAQGKVDAGVAIFWDVTEQHRAEQELRSARLEAEAASRAKSEFLAVMSHELRTPLSAIIGYEELLYDGITGTVNDLQRTQLGRIKASAMHLLSLIDEVLTLSRVEAGREVTHPERIPVFAALHEASTLAEPLVREKGLSLQVVRAPRNLEVWADATKLRQILLNLLSNAIKFTDAGTITLDSRRMGDHVEFDVRDTGIGIDPSDHERVFDTFWQVEQRSTRRVGGTGLGLSVSRRLARLMNGDLTVTSKLGEGSTFTVRLPTPPAT